MSGTAFQSSFLLVMRSIFLRAIGLVSTMCLARLLDPADFGLVALAILIIGFLEVLASAGGEQFVLRDSDAKAETVNTAWTINIILNSTLAIAVLVIAPSVGTSYSNPDLVPILWCFGALAVLQSLESPGLWLLQRDQNVSGVVRLNLIGKLIALPIAVGSALLGAAHWSLVLGRFTTTLINVIGSYFLHNSRPVLTLKGVAKQYAFSGWLMLQSVFGYCRVNLDALLVSLRFSATELGFFHTMKYLAYIPSESLVAPVSAPLLTELSKLRDDPVRFALIHNVYFLGVGLLALPLAALLMLCYEPLVYLVLGSSWVEHSELFKWFSLLIPAFFVFQHVTRVCLAFGNTQLTVLYEVFAAMVIFVPLLFIGIEQLVEFTAMRVQLELVASLGFFIFATSKFLGIKHFFRCLAAVLPVALACFVASVVVTESRPDWSITAQFFYQLMLWISIFLSVLCVLVYLIWKRQAEWAHLLETARATVRRRLLKS
ncbi:MAG: oligosaccharide flippase family protein [Pseudomonadota bacterium]